MLGLRNREKVAVEALYDNYSASLYGVILRIVNETELAEDILQETFVKIWQSLMGIVPKKAVYLPGW